MAMSRPLALLAAEAFCSTSRNSGEHGRGLMRRLARVRISSRRCLNCSAASQSGAGMQPDFDRKFLIVDGSKFLHTAHGFDTSKCATPVILN